MAEVEGTDVRDTLDDRVLRARRQLASAVAPDAPDVAALHRRARRQRVASAAAVGALALIAVMMVGVLRGASDEARSPVVAGEPELRQPGIGNADLLAPGEVRAMASSPLQGRSTMASVWTGQEMIVWGGEGTGRFFADGAAYDPTTDTWRMLAPSPLSARNAPAAVWTGDEVLLWGGHGDSGGQTDGAAYDPATDTWRPIADAPMTSDGLPQAVWTGEQMLVVAGFNSVTAAAYDPGSDTWRSMPPVPGQPLGHEMRAVWTGTHMILRGEYRNAGPSMDMAGGLFTYDPAGDRWSELPPTGHDNAYLTNLAFTGEHLLRVTQEPGALVTRYDFDTETWVGIARWPQDPWPMETSVWTGDQVLLWGGGDDALLIDPDTGTFTTTPAGGGPKRIYPAAVWADGILVVWGGFQDMGDGILLRPVAPDATTTDTTITIPEDDSTPSNSELVPVAGPDGAVGYLDPTPGPVEVNGRLLPIQRVIDDEGNLLGYFACSFLPRDVVESPDFDADSACSTVTTVQGRG